MDVFRTAEAKSRLTKHFESALANSGGRWLVFGIDDDGTHCEPHPGGIGRAAGNSAEEQRRQACPISADRRPVELDQQSVGRLSRMDALQVQAMAQAQEGRRQDQLRRIDAALRRLADGEYGACVECGEDIPAKRLEIDPTVVRCVDCAK